MSTTTTSEPEQRIDPPSLTRIILFGLITRVITDSGVQVFFPFLGIIAAGTGTSETVLGRLVSLRASTGLLAPLFGILADRRGYRQVMSLGLLTAGVGYLVIAASQSTIVLALGMLLAGLGTFAFVPNLTAYLSARLPFHRRSRGLGIVEYAWALAGIVGLSLIGQLIALTSWRTPFVILGSGLLVAGLLYRRLPSARETTPSSIPAARGRLSTFFNLGSNRISAWAVLTAGLFIAMSGFTLILTFGIWLQQAYGLDAAALGQVAFVLGLSDISGSGLISLFGDRLGKRRSVLAGASITLAGLIALPWMTASLTTAVAGLFLARGAFEFTIVSNAILLSEQVPAQRGKVLTLGTASTLLGSTIVGFTAVPIFENFGILGVSLSAAVPIVLSLIIVLAFALETGHPPD